MKLFSSLRTRMAARPAMAQAEAIMDDLEKTRIRLRARKGSLLKRQVELWGILDLSNDLEKEYREVAGEIALIAKQLLSIDEHVRPMRLAWYICKEQDRCDAITAFDFSAVANPLAGVTADTAPVTL